jgi:hypothetical protein
MVVVACNVDLYVRESTSHCTFKLGGGGGVEGWDSLPAINATDFTVCAILKLPSTIL